jgi:hypothetical protein
MHTTTIEQWKHNHDFCGSFDRGEKKTRMVLGLTAVMMVVEIVGGLKLHSMALNAVRRSLCWDVYHSRECRRLYRAAAGCEK